MKKIDAHSHIGSFGGWAGLEFSKEQLFSQMEEYEIEKTFLTSSSFTDNEIVIDAFQSRPDLVVPFVRVNPKLDDVESKLYKYIVKENFKAIKLQPLADAYVADDKIVHPVMEFARQYKVPVFIHCGHPPYSLPWSIALLAEEFPDVNVTMLHMGHGHGVYIDASIKMARRLDNLYLEISGMPMPSKIKEAYETVGSDRVMFGIDSPFHQPSVEIQKVLTSGLNEEQQKRVFYDNAAKLLNL